jgi:hypothetical protein
MRNSNKTTKKNRPSSTHGMRIVPVGKSQVNFNASKDTIEKLSAIAHIERLSKTEVYNKALELFIQKYEAKHGSITKNTQNKTAIDDL